MAAVIDTENTTYVIVEYPLTEWSTMDLSISPLGIMNACLLAESAAHPFIPPPNTHEPVREHRPVIQDVAVGNPVRTEPRHPPWLCSRTHTHRRRGGLDAGYFLTGARR